MKRLATIILTTAMLTLLLSTAAAAKSPHTVEAASLTPPLNPDYTWDCFDTGRGPVCHGTSDDTYENEDVGLTCGGQTVWLTGSFRGVQTRWHLPDGRATKSIVNLAFLDHFSLSATGEAPRVTVRSYFNHHWVYPVPGDASTRVLTELGAVYHATAPGHGVLFQDVGLIRFAPGGAWDPAQIDVFRGPHDLYSSDFEALDRICDVLMP